MNITTCKVGLSEMPDKVIPISHSSRCKQHKKGRGGRGQVFQVVYSILTCRYTRDCTLLNYWPLH